MILSSVILPVFNRERSIVRAIESVLSQTYPSWQLLVIDDCSTDNSFQVASSFKDSRIHVLRIEKNSGAAVARNLGIKSAKGKYVSFLDSDDYYENKFLEESISRMEASNSGVGFCWTGCVFHREKNEAMKETRELWQPSSKGNPYFTFLNELRIGTNSGITIKREVFEAVGLFDETLPAAEDTDLFLRITQKFNYAYVPEYLIHIHQSGDDRLSKRFDKIAIAYNGIIPKHLLAIISSSPLRLKYFYKAMWLNYHLGEKMLARSYFKKVLEDRFFHVNAWTIFLLFELLGKELGSRFHIRLSSGLR